MLIVQIFPWTFVWRRSARGGQSVTSRMEGNGREYVGQEKGYLLRVLAMGRGINFREKSRTDGGR